MQNQYKYTMVSTLGIVQNKKKEYQRFMLVDSNYHSTMVSAEDVVRALTKEPDCISNMEIREGKPISSNGALDRYAFGDLMTGQYVGVPSYVIIDRLESNGELVGYTVYNPQGMIQRIDVATAVKLAKEKLICNGKIRTSSKGKEIVSSIKGDYNVISADSAKQKKAEKIKVQLMFSTMNGNTNISYTGMIVDCVDMQRLSQIITECKKANETMVAKIKPYGGIKAAKELQIVPMAESKFYVVIPDGELSKLCALPSVELKVSNRFSISVMSYKKDGRGDFFYAEAPVKVTGNQMEIGKPVIEEENPEARKSLESALSGYCNVMKKWYSTVAK